ncbi:hypothetical protein Golax_017432, partial [Gossypium laxum]|nr:hypothetical protein [Gossypium laxum]
LLRVSLLPTLLEVPIEYLGVALRLGKTLSNVERVRMGLSNDSFCPICGFHSKDILHILRDCPIAKNIWAQDNRLIHEGGASWAFFFWTAYLGQVLTKCLERSVEAHTTEERVYLNTDRAVQLDSGFAAAGGIENQWFLRYIPREQNQVADCLAKQTLIEKDNLQILNIPPMIARTFIDMDKS